jgi:hypothetical protein
MYAHIVSYYEENKSGVYVYNYHFAQNKFSIKKQNKTRQRMNNYQIQVYVDFSLTNIFVRKLSVERRRKSAILLSIINVTRTIFI